MRKISQLKLMSIALKLNSRERLIKKEIDGYNRKLERIYKNKDKILKAFYDFGHYYLYGVLCDRLIDPKINIEERIIEAFDTKKGKRVKFYYHLNVYGEILFKHYDKELKWDCSRKDTIKISLENFIKELKV